jgi:hypothetical protein
MPFWLSSPYPCDFPLRRTVGDLVTDEITQLRDLVVQASTKNPHLISRLEKGAFLLLLRPIEQTAPGVWRVGSEDGLRMYVIRNGHCDCSDYVRHGRGHPCKHRLALMLQESLEKKHHAVSGKFEETV